MSQTDKIAAVTDCVHAFAAVEKHLEAGKDLFADLNATIKAAHKVGVGKQAEFLQITNGLEAQSGKLSAALEKTLTIHARCTEIAKREGCDVALPGSYAIDGGVTPMGGGSR